MSIIKNTKELKIKKIFDLNGKNTLKRGPFGSALKKSFFVSTGFKVYEQKNAIRKNINDGDYYINENKYQELINFNLLPNDIIVSCSGTVGEVYMIPENAPEGVINQALLRIRLSKNDFPLYYYYYFSSSRFKSKLLQDAMGGVIKNISGMETLNNIEVIDISYEEQKKITKILKLQDDRLKNLKNLLEKIEIRNQYYAEKLLTGELNVNNLSVNTEYKNTFMNNRDTKVSLNFNIDKVKNIFNVSRGKVISKEYIDKHIGDYPVYSSATLNNGEIGRINSYQLDGKYITWTTDGVYAGTVFYRDGKFNCTNICGILDIKIDGNLKYFSIILKKYLPLFVTKLGNSKLMSNTVEEIEIPFTKNIDEQNKIANFIEKLETEKEKVEKLLKLEEQRFEWLSDKLLSGEYVIED